MGSRTGPTVLDNGDPPRMAAGLARVPPRPMNLERSVSQDVSLGSPPWSVMRLSIHGGFSSGELARRVQRIAEDLGMNSVCTKRLLNAGWDASEAGFASTTSA